MRWMALGRYARTWVWATEESEKEGRENKGIRGDTYLIINPFKPMMRLMLLSG